ESDAPGPAYSACGVCHFLLLMCWFLFCSVDACSSCRVRDDQPPRSTGGAMLDLWAGSSTSQVGRWAQRAGDGGGGELPSLTARPLIRPSATFSHKGEKARLMDRRSAAREPKLNRPFGPPPCFSRYTLAMYSSGWEN